ncbi:ORF6N domain-containing protein [Providencia stuartii]|uniref:ORF6N domain-containing protein n=1 Tax=Providencia stuartii TaxID=588 RepID=UPI0023E14746|nr:ORF6N domain-containing protein [Providencia stuartii]ELR5142469.1 ORF6N domain-containing protein [Providencia stuartii]WER21485.1 ORF6N domain-containing protein [Providencia stuartii]WER25605.1 ORF6N domain-containing protein [Providencia stuartii]WER29695.1 ORF6N domain-containing protein [Providencia stuartii]
MNNVSNINETSNSVKSMPLIAHSGAPVITTDMLADVYGTEVINIQVNHSRNKNRFIEGKHFYKLTGSILKEFKNWLTKSKLVYKGSEIISKHAKSIILWTERGAARHAKMLDTDNAWDVFEALEDFYFAKKEDAQQKINLRQSTAKELTPLRQTAERLIATGVGNIYPDIWKHVHKEFGVDHINELLPEQIPQAISFLDALEGEYIPKQQLPQVGLESLAMPMSFFDEYDWLFEEENISKKEALSHADAYPRCMLKTAPEYPNPVGVLLNKLQSAGVDVSAAQIQLRALRNHLRATIMQLEMANRSDLKMLLNNTNVVYKHLKAIREEWRNTLSPAIEKLNPELESHITSRLADAQGATYSNLCHLQKHDSTKAIK